MSVGEALTMWRCGDDCVDQDIIGEASFYTLSLSQRSQEALKEDSINSRWGVRYRDFDQIVGHSTLDIASM